MKKHNGYLFFLSIVIAFFGALSLPIQKTNAASIPWGKAAWIIVKKGSDAVYNVPASSSSGKYGQTSTPGSIEFNGSKYGASAKYTVTSQSTKHSLALYAQANPVNIGKKYSLVVLNPKGNYTINTSITPGVYRGFKFGLKGNYTVQFVANNKLKMTPYVAYRYDSANSVYGTKIASGTDVLQRDSKINSNETSYVNGYGEMATASWGSNVVRDFNDKQINVHQLFEQFNDNGKTVYSLKNYQAGDTIKLNDKVREVDFDAANNESKIFFESNQSNDEYLKYKGDLRSELKPGVTFTKNMNVQNLGNNASFRLPDYFKYLLDNENSAPNFNN